METEKVLEEIKDIMEERLKFDPSRTSELTLATVLPKGMEGSLGLDSLDFIEMSIAIEERFGFVIDETEDVETHFESLGALVAYIKLHTAGR
jgi:acyl carrier protein